MLATAGANPFDSPMHLFEIKWDGVRTLAFCEGGATRLFSRSGREVTGQYPEFADLHRKLKVGNAVLDGEIVALNSMAMPSFELLQGRINLSRGFDIARGVERIPLDFVLFDLVFSEGEWRGGLPLEARLDLLDRSMSWDGRILKSDPVPENGVALFEAVNAKGLEGIVAKRLGSPYLPGKRSRDWIKVKTVQRADCVIGGWTKGQGNRSGSIGALLLGAYDSEGNLRYVGSVGTGFTDRRLDFVRRSIEQIESTSNPFSERPAIKTVSWCRPELVCEVEYRELTAATRLRAPSFKALRSDKSPAECRLSDLYPIVT